MNTPEKIVQGYLRLNGFFTIPYFTLLQSGDGQIDFLAVRLGESIEKVGPNKEALRIDDDFLRRLGITQNDSVGIVVEVKSSEDDKAEISSDKFDYAKSFFGNIQTLHKVGFESSNEDFTNRNGQTIVSLRHCLIFIKERFKELKKIDQKLKSTGGITKTGSWHLSEEFLSDLLFLKNLSF